MARTSKSSKPLLQPTDFLTIPELATAARIKQAYQVMRLPPATLVLYTERIHNLIETGTFGSIARVRQLGFTHMVYPGATGTRFEHSMGVYELACRLLIKLSSQTQFRASCTTNDAKLFLLAAILHDTGHFPFAHQIEEFPSNCIQSSSEPLLGLLRGHHERTNSIIDKFRPNLRRDFGLESKEIDALKYLISPHEQRHPVLSNGVKLLKPLLDGPIDIDKLDYMERDAYHCGVQYGANLDVERILETIRFLPKSPYSETQTKLAFDIRGAGCLEQMITARHHLFANVYWHRAVRSATSMFKHALFLLLQNEKAGSLVADIFLRGTSEDSVLVQLLQTSGQIAQGSESLASIECYLKSLTGDHRNLFKAYLDVEHRGRNIQRLGSYDYNVQRSCAKRIYQELQNRSLTVNSGEAFALGANNVLIDQRLDHWPSFGKVKIFTRSNTVENLSECISLASAVERSFVEQACRSRVFINKFSLKPQYRRPENRWQVSRHIEEIISQ